MQNSSATTQGFLAALLASAIWGGMYVVSRVVLQVISPVTLVAIRMVVSAVVMFLLLKFLGRSWKLPREIWARVFLMGLVGYAFSITAQFMGTKLGGAALGSLITTAAPVVTVGISSVLGLERVTWRAWLGLLLSLVALLLLSGGGNANFSGVLWLVAAAVSWGVLSFIGGQVVAKTDVILVTAWASLIAAMLLLPLSPFGLAGMAGWPNWSELRLGHWAGIAYLGVVSTALAFAAWVYGVSRAGAVLSGIAFFAQPLVGSLLGWLLLGEHLGQNFFVAAVLLIAGAWLAQQPTGQS